MLTILQPKTETCNISSCESYGNNKLLKELFKAPENVAKHSINK